jgi:methylene-tetrahydromethanopterin dehydrogenase
MDKPYILHMLTSAKNLSPFDVNMALDAGWVAAMPYTNVTTEEVQGLVQDAIFSRSPKALKRTGLFIGGRDTLVAVQMLRAAKDSMMPPFAVSAFADPSGAFTTAAGMVALAEQSLSRQHQTDLSGKTLLVLGGTGPVGQISAVLSAQAGARVYLIGRQLEKARQVAELCNREFGNGQTEIQGEADANKGELIQSADLVFATGAAGIQLLSAEMVAAAPQLKVAADVNAVPPSGIAGLSAHHKGTPIEGSNSGAVGIGALAIGNVKYQTQSTLLKRMRELQRDADKPVFLHFEHAFETAREIVGRK